MLTLLVSDIFGKTPCFNHLAECLPGKVDTFDPYEGKNMGFLSEHQAYDFFEKQVGIESYTHKLELYLLNLKEPVRVFAFSVGATALWRVSGSHSSIQSGICFYGSKIRFYTQVQPLFPIKLVLPKYEEGFSVGALIEALLDKENVDVEHVESLHGFMNELSGNYDMKKFSYYLSVMKMAVVELNHW